LRLGAHGQTEDFRVAFWAKAERTQGVPSSALLEDPLVIAGWKQRHGAPPGPEALEQLFAEFKPLQVQVLRGICDVIPGIPAVVEELRTRRIRIANTTGFDTDMMQELTTAAEAGGYHSALRVGPDLAGQGRPAPRMAFYTARHLNVFPMRTIVIVGDTPAAVAGAAAASLTPGICPATEVAH
jgi:phosphonoacetaldehyde hydrolase